MRGRGARSRFAATTVLAASSFLATAGEAPLRVGVYHNPPKVVVLEGASPSGFWPELTRAIADAEGLTIEWVPGDWSTLLTELESGHIDVLVDVAVSSARRERMRFSEQTVHVSWSRVFGKSGTAIEVIPDLRDRRIGVLKGSVNVDGNEGIRPLLASYGIAAEIVPMADYLSVFAALAEGRIDAGVVNRDFGNRMSAYFDVAATPILLQPAELRYAFSPTSARTPALIARFDTQLAALKADTNSVYHQLLQQWLGQGSGNSAGQFPEWTRWALLGLLLTALLLAAAIGAVELRVRARTRQLRASERRLRQRDLMLAASQRLAQIGSWEMDMVSRTVIWSDETYRILGVSPDDFSPTPKRFFSFVHDEDSKRLQDSVQQLLDTDQECDVTFRIHRSDGVLRHIQALAEVERDAQGKPCLMHGALQDITTRTQADEEKARLERGLSETMASITDALFTLDHDWRFTFVNAAFERQVGVAASEIIGHNIWEAFPEAKGSALEDAYIRAVTENVTVVLEEYYEPLGKWLAIRAFPSNDGLTVYFQDITERHKLVEHLLKQQSELQKSHNALQALLASRRALIDSLPAHIALLDGNGVIIDVNEQWRRFARSNAFQSTAFGIGSNYIDICESATGEFSEEADPMAKGLRAVLDGLQPSFTMEYPCHAPGELRWFRVTVNRLVPDQPVNAQYAAVVMHVDITERKLTEQKLEHIAFEDTLTGLPTRNGFLRILETHVGETKGHWPANALLVAVNIKGMRDINDALGFDTGDDILARVGRRLLKQSVAFCLAGRTGGDEFVAYFQPAPDDDADVVLDRLAKSLTDPLKLGDLEIDVTARIGFTQLGSTARALTSLLREAELALAHHRDAAQLRWVAFSRALDAADNQRIELTRELRTGLREQQFELHYQPKVILDSGQMHGCEALLRWNHPRHGMMLPGHFITIAEKSQLISPIGDWVLRESCKQLRCWMDAGLTPVRVAVNVSLVQFLTGDLPKKVAALLSEFALPSELLALEITESVFERESDALKKQLHALHATGVHLSLDDFGTGYSSLLYLQKYPFDEIKVDRAFVMKLLEDRYSRNIVRTVFELARAYGAEVVAEGIESVEVSMALQRLNYRVGQGRYFSYPLPGEEFQQLLALRPALPLPADKTRITM